MEQMDQPRDSRTGPEAQTATRQLRVSRPPVAIGQNGLEFRTEIRLDLAIELSRLPVQRFLKRIIDLSLALLGLIALSPLLLLVAILIKLDSEGPVLFMQRRVGKAGRFFTMYKFRSMYINAAELRQKMNLERRPGDPRDTKVRNDPRVTRIGLFMRRTSIDELPQLFNVIFGDMSLVGPRPALASEAIEWDPQYFYRLAVEQGCTCIWQVSGRSDTTFQDQMRMDAQYVRDWNLWMDFKLMVRTVFAILTGRGAY